METGYGCRGGILACLLITSVLFCGCARNSGNNNKKPMISAAQRALDMWEVQNVMSKHAYYHQIGRHHEELDKIWVTKTPNPTFSQPRGSWVGMESIRASYGDVNYENQKKSLAEFSKIHSKIKNEPENLGIGIWLIHTLTTPIIEIAGDGNTAKAMWYSPGAGVNASPDGKKASGTWFFEKYGVDFAKEDGQWKIWHIQMFYDLTGPLEKGFADVPVRGPGPEGREAAERPPEDPRMIPTKLNPDPYPEWNPTRVPKMIRMPEPYYTFSETFSY